MFRGCNYTFSCSTQLNSVEHEISPPINVKMPRIVGILTVTSRKNSILGLSEPEKKLNVLICLYLRAFKISCSAEFSMEKVL